MMGGEHHGTGTRPFHIISTTMYGAELDVGASLLPPGRNNGEKVFSLSTHQRRGPIVSSIGRLGQVDALQP